MMIEIAQRVFEAQNGRDFEAFQRLYAPNALIHGADGPMEGPQALIALSKEWVEAIPDLEALPLHFSEDGDVVIVHWRVVGEQVAPFRGMEGGRRAKCYGHTCLRIKDKQVVEHWACVDYRALAS